MVFSMSLRTLFIIRKSHLDISIAVFAPFIPFVSSFPSSSSFTFENQFRFIKKIKFVSPSLHSLLPVDCRTSN